MRADEDVRVSFTFSVWRFLFFKMISAEAPVLFSKACELFITEITHKAWFHTKEGKRRTLQKNDIAGSIITTEIFDFLRDLIPKEDYPKHLLENNVIFLINELITYQ
jgi:hypothetical protein